MSQYSAHLSQKLRHEIDRLLGEIELDLKQQRAIDDEFYSIPYGHLSRLIAVGMPTLSVDSDKFVLDLFAFIEELPDCAAKAVLKQIQEHPENASAVWHLYRESRWQSLGCPVVSVESRLAASLMLSECPLEILDDLHPPWDSFVIRLPKSLIEFGGVSYTHLAVHRFNLSGPTNLEEELSKAGQTEDMLRIAKKVDRWLTKRQGVHWGLYGMSGDRAHLQGEGPLVEQLGRTERLYLMEPEMPIGSSDEKVMSLFARLAVGVCLLVQSEGTLRRKSPPKGSRGSSRMGSKPMTTDYVLGHSIAIGYDCVEAVKTYIAGEARSLPTIQWLVRGHWRSQPIGVGRGGRKRIWILPHWKGPQDAPRLFREYEFNPSLTTPSEVEQVGVAAL